MLPFAIASDVHLHNWTAFSKTLPTGVNSRLQFILDELTQSANHLKSIGGQTYYIAGDLFHVRGSISPSVLNPTLDVFRSLIDQGIKFRIIPGNHDLESKDTSRLTNAVQALEQLGCEICNKPTYFQDDNVLMLPWYDKLDDLRGAIELSTALIPIGCRSSSKLIIHAPLNNVIPGLPDHGLTPEELTEFGFQQVFVGHYHNHKAFEGGVYSIGATTHQTWGDTQSKAGYLIVKDGVQHIPSKAPLFVDFDADWDDEVAKSSCEGCYVRVRLDEASDSEVSEIRNTLEGWGALGVVIQAQPKAKVGARTTSMKGKTLEGSIGDWIEENASAYVDKKQLNLECLQILSEVEAVEGDTL